MFAHWHSPVKARNNFIGVLTRAFNCFLLGSAYLLAPWWRTWVSPCSVTKASAGGHDRTAEQGRLASSVIPSAAQREREQGGTPAREPWIFNEKKRKKHTHTHRWNMVQKRLDWLLFMFQIYLWARRKISAVSSFLIHPCLSTLF